MLCMMIVGIVMLVLYIVLFVIAEQGIILLSDDFWLDVLLWGGAAFFAFGLVFLITGGRASKKQLALAFVIEYEFYPEGLVINDYRSGERPRRICAISILKRSGRTRNFSCCTPIASPFTPSTR